MSEQLKLEVPQDGLAPPEEPEVIGGEIVCPETAAPSAETGLAIHDGRARPMTIQDGLSLLPVAQLGPVLQEYDDRRNFFRKWLLSHLQEGIHYGFPPGCEVKLDADGNILQYNKKKGGYVMVPKAQWRAHPSLYKAGALLLVDLLKLKPTFDADDAAWKQLGSKEGTFVFRCTLYDPASGKALGEGRGIFAVGEKYMEANPAIKMAQKRALVDAVINTVAVCADLFQQDMEDVQPPPADAPGADPNAPKAPSRRTAQTAPPPTDGAGVLHSDEYRKLVAEWKQRNPDRDRTEFVTWAGMETGVDLTVGANWTMAIVSTLRANLA